MSLTWLEIKRPGDDEASDAVEYNQFKRIVSYWVFSPYLQDWVETSVLTIKASWPSSYEKALDQVDADYEYKKHTDSIDFQIQQSLEDKLTGEGA